MFVLIIIFILRLILNPITRLCVALLPCFSFSPYVDSIVYEPYGDEPAHERRCCPRRRVEGLGRRADVHVPVY